MKRFHYLRDPACLAATAGYALNRWGLRPAIPHPFLQGYFNDLLLIPAALPWVLWLQRQTGLRHHDHPPTAGEVALHAVVWSLVCEVFGPRFLGLGTADPRDVAAYLVGGLAAWIAWNLPRRRAQPAP